MLCTLKIKLVPTQDQFDSLLATMKQFNRACNHISKLAFNTKTFSKIKLQKDCYYNVREQFGLSAQMVVRAIGKVTESYIVDRNTLHIFKETGAMIYDQRILSFDGLESASLLTLNGRVFIPMILGNYHKELMFGRRIRGQADLILQDNIFYLILVVERPEEPFDSNGNFLGIDIGIVNIAADSTGEVFSGNTVNAIRSRNARLRKKLQAKDTKSAKRLLKKRSRKEQRFARDVNHCISKSIVQKAKALNVGIALEDLTGIRTRIEKTVVKQQRSQQSSWAFYQLRQFIEYKATIMGIPVILVDPRNTSRECPICGYIDKLNRKTRNDFHCLACGYAAFADNVAAANISNRAVCQSAKRGAA